MPSKQPMAYNPQRKTYLSLYALFLLTACEPQDQSYFPLNNDWEYIYNTSTTTPFNQEQGQYSIKNLGRKQLEGSPVYLRRNSQGTNYYFTEDKASGDIARVAKRTSAQRKPIMDATPRFVYKYPLTVETQWSMPARAYLMDRPFSTEDSLTNTQRFEMNYQVLSTSETIQVSLGTYENCLHIRGVAKFKLGRILTVIQDPVEITTDEWYAKGIGLIKLHRKESVTSKYAYGGDYEMQLSVLNKP